MKPTIIRHTNLEPTGLGNQFLCVVTYGRVIEAVVQLYTETGGVTVLEQEWCFSTETKAVEFFDDFGS